MAMDSGALKKVLALSLGSAALWAVVIACSRNDVTRSDHSEVVFNLARNGTLSATSVAHMGVTVSAPGMPVQIFTFDRCPGGGENCPYPMMAPSTVSFSVPKGVGRLVQVLIAEDSTGQMLLKYGDVLRDFSSDVESVTLTLTSVGGIDTSSHVEVFGYDCMAADGPAVTYLDPGAGKPLMPFKSFYSYNGLFEVGFPPGMRVSLVIGGRTIFDRRDLKDFTTSVSGTNIVHSSNNSSGGTETLVAYSFGAGNGCPVLTSNGNEDAGNESVGGLANAVTNTDQLKDHRSPWGNRQGPLDYFRVGRGNTNWSLKWVMRSGTDYVRIFRKFSTDYGQGRFSCDYPLPDVVQVSGDIRGTEFVDTSTSISNPTAPILQYYGCAYDASGKALPGFSTYQTFAGGSAGGGYNYYYY